MLHRPGGLPPRFSVIITVQDREDVVGRAVAGVLAQTFADVEVVVVDDGSTDNSVAAARAVADHRVRIVRQERSGIAAARTSGLERATGDWITVLDPDDEVASGWLARLGRLIDSTGAALVSCGGEHRHLDHSTTEVAPMAIGPAGMRATACFRSGAFTTTRERLLEVGGFGGPGDSEALTEVGLRLLGSVGDHGGKVSHTPEVMVRWNEREVGPVPEGDALRLRWALQGLDAVARSPIPDAEMLSRYATVGGIAAARQRDHREARRLLCLARQAQPEVMKHWARWVVSCLSPISDRIWLPSSELAPSETPRENETEQHNALNLTDEATEEVADHLADLSVESSVDLSTDLSVDLAAAGPALTHRDLEEHALDIAALSDVDGPMSRLHPDLPR